ncbi:hypothetical protein Tco_0095313 [Tanacetum coccineum]
MHCQESSISLQNKADAYEKKLIQVSVLGCYYCDDQPISCISFRESLGRALDGTEALLLPKLFILWLARLSTDKEKYSTDRPNKGTDMQKVSTNKEKDSTDRPDEYTVDQTKGRSATPTTPTPTPTTFRDDETIAQVLLNMSQAKAVSREKEKGVELKDVENIERPRPTSTRSLLTLKPLPKIDPKDKGKKKIEEDKSDTE